MGISAVSLNFGMDYRAISPMRYNVYPGFAQITTSTPDFDSSAYAITFDYKIPLTPRDPVDLAKIAGNFLLEHKAGESKVSISACQAGLSLNCTLWKEQT
jgi:hypothetical protein